MIINLKQTEIEQALRAYVASQGISLHGKDLTISFTAGRRESGISAEISIDDAEIPGYTNDTHLETQGTKAPGISLASAATTSVEAPAVEEAPAPVVAEEVAVEPQEEVIQEEATVPAKATVSLFG